MYLSYTDRSISHKLRDYKSIVKYIKSLKLLNFIQVSKFYWIVGDSCTIPTASYLKLLFYAFSCNCNLLCINMHKRLCFNIAVLVSVDAILLMVCYDVATHCIVAA